jgi:hypothetical protein
VCVIHHAATAYGGIWYASVYSFPPDMYLAVYPAMIFLAQTSSGFKHTFACSWHKAKLVNHLSVLWDAKAFAAWSFCVEYIGSQFVRNVVNYLPICRTLLGMACTVYFEDFVIFSQQIHNIIVNNICFLKHCYMFRCLCIIIKELLIYAKVTVLV